MGFGGSGFSVGSSWCSFWQRRSIRLPSLLKKDGMVTDDGCLGVEMLM